MCLARIYIETDGNRSKREPSLTDVASIQLRPGEVVVRELLGKEQIIRGRVAAVDFLESTVTIARPKP